MEWARRKGERRKRGGETRRHKGVETQATSCHIDTHTHKRRANLLSAFLVALLSKLLELGLVSNLVLGAVVKQHTLLHRLARKVLGNFGKVLWGLQIPFQKRRLLLCRPRARSAIVSAAK